MSPRPSGVRIVALTAALALVTALAPASMTAGANAVSVCDSADFAGGDGSTLSPFIIETPAQLANIGLPGCVNGGYFFAITEDLDLSSYSNWTPIGDDVVPFDGLVHGGCHDISGLVVDGTDYAGLFGKGETAGFAYMRITDADVTGTEGSSGILAGALNSAYVALVSIDGTLRDDGGASSDYGLVAGRWTGLIIGEGIDLKGEIDAATSSHVGGAVGQLDSSGNDPASLSGITSVADVSGTEAVGGLIGSAVIPAGNIAESFSRGTVTASSQPSGGLIGDSAGGLLVRVYSAGLVQGASNTGGLIGLNDVGDNTDYSESYWDTEATGQATTAGPNGTGVAGKTTTEMKTSSTFVNWENGIYIWVQDGVYPQATLSLATEMFGFSAVCPGITTVSPSTVPASGGQVVLSGRGLSNIDRSTVKVGGASVTPTLSEDGESMTVTVPPGSGAAAITYSYLDPKFEMIVPGRPLELSYEPPAPSGKKAQRLVAPGWASSIAAKGTTRVVRLPLRTNAESSATVRVTCRPALLTRSAPAGDARPCKVVTTATGVRVVVSGRIAVRVRAVVTAPGTDTYKRLRVVKTWRT